MKYKEEYEKFKIDDGIYRINRIKYFLKICIVCNELCLIVRDGNYCTRGCAGEARSGENSPLFGKKASKETKRKMSEWQKGKKGKTNGR